MGINFRFSSYTAIVLSVKTKINIFLAIVTNYSKSCYTIGTRLTRCGVARYGEGCHSVGHNVIMGI